MMKETNMALFKASNRLLWAFWLLVATMGTGQAQEKPDVRVLVKKVPMVVDLAIWENGDQLVYCEEGNASVYFWDVARKRVVSKKTGLPGQSRSLSVAPKLKRIAIATGVGLGIWDGREDKWTFDKTPGYCLVARYSPDEKFLVNTFEESFALWDARSGEHIKSFHDHSRLINDIAYSSNGSLLATCDSGGFLNIYDLRKQERVKTKEFPDPDRQLLRVHFLPRSKILLIGLTKNVVVWDYQKDKILHTISSDRVRQLVLSEAGDVLYVVSASIEESL